MEYSKELAKIVEAKLISKAEELAKMFNESISNYVSVVIENDDEEETFNFKVDISVGNYKYEEETNSASYDIAVFVSAIPHMQSEYYEDSNYKDFYDYLTKKVFLETIYKSENV